MFAAFGSYHNNQFGEIVKAAAALCCESVIAEFKLLQPVMKCQ